MPIPTYRVTYFPPHFGSGLQHSIVDVPATVAKALAAHPGAVIIDGTDDWNAPRELRPESFVQDLGLKPLALFHTGVSGISSSGIVVSKEDAAKIPESVLSRLRVYRA